MKTKTTAHITLDIDDVRRAEGVEEAIAKWCEDSDDTSCGVIGSTFSTSGPGPGWSKTHGPDDFASRAFEGGALYYIDETDGRMKSAEPVEDDDDDDDDDDSTILTDIGGCKYREGDWSDESVVCLQCPSEEDVLEYPELVAEMAEAVIKYHHAESDGKQWAALVRKIKDAADALDDIDPDKFATE